MRLRGPFRKLFGMSKRDHGHHAEGQDLEYEVPYVHQNHINLCGDSVAQMLLMFNGRPATVGLKPNAGHDGSSRIRKNPRGVLDDAGYKEIARIITSSGLYPLSLYPTGRQWTADRIRAALETFGPYAQTVRFSALAYHWVVVTGIDGRFVIYHDPWRGQNSRKTINEWLTVALADKSSVIAATDDIPKLPPEIEALLL